MKSCSLRCLVVASFQIFTLIMPWYLTACVITTNFLLNEMEAKMDDYLDHPYDIISDYVDDFHCWWMTINMPARQASASHCRAEFTRGRNFDQAPFKFPRHKVGALPNNVISLNPYRHIVHEAINKISNWVEGSFSIISNNQPREKEGTSD